jgi:Protein of unknown function (DUF2510)
MDLPPSGWYPDPYGTPSLLRWWDGSVWTQHTHPDVSAGGAGAGGGEQAALQVTTVQPAAHATAVRASAGQGTLGQAGPGQTATLQAGPGLATGQHRALPVGMGHGGTGQLGAGQLGTGQPSADWLRRTKPPTGRPTQPQPALPATAGPGAFQPAVTTVQPATLQPTTVQPAAVQQTAVQQTTVQPTTVQPAALQPTTVQPGYPQPGFPPSGALASLAGPAGGGDGAGTQVMYFGGDSWQAPGGPGLPVGPGGPGVAGGGPGGPGNRYGYLEAQRRRRRRLIVGVTAGTAAAVAVIAVIALNVGRTPATSTADQTQVTPSAAATTAAPLATPSASASPTATATATASPAATGSLLSDGQSGLSYSLLSTPWAGASCPSSLNNGAFTWTAGEYAEAGQINNGSTAWYGEACSGPLPASYGYTGTADLQDAAQNLASTFSGAYYNDLAHTVTEELNQGLTVSGHDAWEITYDISYTDAAAQGASWTDEQAAVVVVDTGTSEPAVFFTSVPSTLNEANVATLVSSLQVTSAAGTTATAAASGAPAASAGQ